MRVISGKLRGRQLVPFKGGHLRPTTDRVKETIFNKLMGLIEGASVLDLFSGTGNLGIEALSRGARRVVSVESHRSSLKIISQNHRKLGIEGEVEVVAQDVLRFLNSYGEADEKFEIVLIDPPFTKKMAHEVMELMADSNVIAHGGWVVIESSSQERIDSEYRGFSQLDFRSFGDKNVSFFERVDE